MSENHMLHTSTLLTWSPILINVID